MSDLAAQVRALLELRDRARRGQLFRPDRGIAADAAFVAQVVNLVTPRDCERCNRLEDELAAARRSEAPGAPQAPRATRSPRKPPAKRSASVTAPSRGKRAVGEQSS